MRVNGRATKCFDDHERCKTYLLGRSLNETELTALFKTALPWAELRLCLPAGLGEPGAGARRGVTCALFVGPSACVEFVSGSTEPCGHRDTLCLLFRKNAVVLVYL